jgi:hypothetical protein
MVAGDGRLSINRSPLMHHYSRNAARKGFVRLAYVYFSIHAHRVWTEDCRGKVIFDTDRGDYLNREEHLVRVSRRENLPLLVGRLKTVAGLRALKNRMETIQKGEVYEPQA